MVIGFEIKIGARAGTMSICIPFNVIEPVIGKLGTQSWLAYSRRAISTDQERSVTRNLRHAKVNARAYLGTTSITVREFMSLAPGDIIKLDKTVTEDFVLQVEGRNKFAGKLGRFRGYRSLQITRRAPADELI